MLEDGFQGIFEGSEWYLGDRPLLFSDEACLELGDLSQVNIDQVEETHQLNKLFVCLFVGLGEVLDKVCHASSTLSGIRLCI